MLSSLWLFISLLQSTRFPGLSKHFVVASSYINDVSRGFVAAATHFAEASGRFKNLSCILQRRQSTPAVPQQGSIFSQSISAAAQVTSLECQSISQLRHACCLYRQTTVLKPNPIFAANSYQPYAATPVASSLLYHSCFLLLIFCTTQFKSIGKK